MLTRLELVEEEALKLTPGERSALAQHLLASLEQGAEVEEAWAVEVERRITAVESGSVQAIPLAEALAQARAALRMISPEDDNPLAETVDLLRSPANAERLLAATAQLGAGKGVERKLEP